METRCRQYKGRISELLARIFLNRSPLAPMERKVLNFKQNLQIIVPGQISAKDGPEKTTAKSYFAAARFQVLDGNRSTKTTTSP